MPDLAPDSRDTILIALADAHVALLRCVDEVVVLQDTLDAWQAIAKAALGALDNQIAEVRRLRNEGPTVRPS